MNIHGGSAECFLAYPGLGSTSHLEGKHGAYSMRAIVVTAAKSMFM